MIAEAEIAALERAIVASVAPAQVREIGGWLVPLDDGSIGRAKSAVPLSHAPDLAAFDAVEAAYAAAGLPPAFRLAEVPGLAAAEAELVRRGFAAHTPTLMKLGTAAGLAALTRESAELTAAPDAAWIAAFTGEGFDPEEGAARVRNLARSPGVAFAQVRDGGRTLAVGVGSFNDGWLGIHGMRTTPAARRQGHASRILAALGREAQARSLSSAVLQVVEDNPARTLYRAAGFKPAWRYRYWGKP